MAKLYPPYINGTIPAFCYTEGTDASITVPFAMNKAVAPSEVAGFALKIKTVNNKLITIIKQTYKMDNVDLGNLSINFTIPKAEASFLVGQYYKIQLAYLSIDADDDTIIDVGYYSTVGIIKCTKRPTVFIEGMEEGTNFHHYSYTGVYSQKNGDATEKMYSYRFVLTDSNGNIVSDSGEQLHNTSFDTLSYEAHDEFSIDFDFDSQQVYYLQFFVTTINRLQVSSPPYRVIQQRSIPAELSADLVALRNFEEGYIELQLAANQESLMSGSFIVCRANNRSNYAWREIHRFNTESMIINEWSFKDYTVEQGVTYKYSIQQYNAQDVRSERIVSNSIYMDFEDMFLYDGERQLKIRFNPQVSSFKTTILENKTDTMGSQFPFFSRNGRVSYKEFPISGLISYLSDQNENFIRMKEIGLDKFSDDKDVYGKYSTTNLVDYNIAAERFFKHEVLDWLNDGQVKLFKSPAEGNFLVRLMGTSLSPIDSLSRMLHSFSATAYEVADFNDDNLFYYGLINPDNTKETEARWVTIDIKELVNKYLSDNHATLQQAKGQVITLNDRSAFSLAFADLWPGSYVGIKLQAADSSENIQIGVTGAYQYETSNLKNAITSITYTIGDINQGQVTYGYLTKNVSIFTTITGLESMDIPIRQFIGLDYYNEIKNWDKNNPNVLDKSSTNLFDVLNDVRTYVPNILFVRAFKRPIQYLYREDNFQSNTDRENFLAGPNNPNWRVLKKDSTDQGYWMLWTDPDCTERWNPSGEAFMDPWTIYQIRWKADTNPYNTINNYRYYVDANLDEFAPILDICFDGMTGKPFFYHEDMFDFECNHEKFSVAEDNVYNLRSKDVPIIHLKGNDGVVLEIGYFAQITTFNIEVDSTNDTYYLNAQTARQIYFNEEATIKRKVKNGTIERADLLHLKEIYETYIIALNKALQHYKEENGLVE